MTAQVERFRCGDWETYWAGDWAILDCSYWGEFYTRKGFSEKINLFVPQTIIEWKNDKSTCYLRVSDKEKFAKKVVELIKQDESLVDETCNCLKQAADEFLKFVEYWIERDIRPEQYVEYQNLILDYYPFHIQVKVLVDFLPQDLLQRFLPKFQEARVYAEPVFTSSIHFVNKFAETTSQKTGYSSELIKALTREEFENWMQTKKLPERNVLEKRNAHSFLLCSGGKTLVETGASVAVVEDFLITKMQGNSLKGTIAFPGKVKGRVKIVNDPQNAGGFKQGDILVAAMTRPEYLPLIQKASAFITDGGGVLSHAAIVARELKKPCIIGAKIATKWLKDGDLVEVDAERGVVRKLRV